MAEYYVHKNSGGACFVKEAAFFEEQGGLREPWGAAWRKVSASSIEEAREICRTARVGRRFYIATRLENHAAHNEIRDALTAAGHAITYDWTTHGPVWREGAARIRDIAVAEREGVRDADFIVALLPGGRGTHVEIGMALAYGKPVLMIGPTEMFGATPETCAFYHDPLAARCDSIAVVVAKAGTL